VERSLSMSFFTDVIKVDPRFTSTAVCKDMALLEPVTRAAAEALIVDAAAMGIALIVTETFRSQARQEYLFSRHLTQLEKAGVHEYGLAFDVARIEEGKADWTAKGYYFLDQLAPKHGLVWGGTWEDHSDPEAILRPGFHDWDHLQRIEVAQQEALFNGWYPPEGVLT
jgi:hypothetical protein